MRMSAGLSKTKSAAISEHKQPTTSGKVHWSPRGRRGIGLSYALEGFAAYGNCIMQSLRRLPGDMFLDQSKD
jgi:hypothetical protein